MNLTKEFLSESVNGAPIKVTGLASVSSVNRAVASNVATIEAVAHELANGDFIYLKDMTDSTYDGIHEVTVVDVDHFTFPLTHADEAEVADATGVVQKITLIHTAVTGTTYKDELWINVTNTEVSNVQIALFFGEEEVSDYYTVASRDSKRVVVAGEVLNNSKLIYMRAITSPDSIKVTGYVNRENA